MLLRFINERKNCITSNVLETNRKYFKLTSNSKVEPKMRIINAFPLNIQI